MTTNCPKRIPRWTRPFIAIMMVACSWYGMMGVHEAGHAVAAMATGGGVKHIHLPLVGFSRTDFYSNPHPLIVAWAGPVLGCAAGLVLWGLARLACRGIEPGLRFFAGFCLIANGAYLGVGWIDRIGDAGDLMRHGGQVWQLIAFGLLTVPTGLYLWHGLRPGWFRK